MHSHALPMLELRRQELLAEAARERRLEQLVRPASADVRPGRLGLAALVHRLSNTLARLHPAAHGTAHVPAH